MGNITSNDHLYNPVQREWLKISYPKLNEALGAGNTSSITLAVQSLNQRFPGQGILDLETALKWMESQRTGKVKLFETIAMKEFPASTDRFSTIIPCKLNRVPLFALIDCGADRSFISMELAKECNLLHLLDMDSKWIFKAYGIGEELFVGRIHICLISLGDEEIQVPFPLLVMKTFRLRCVMLGLDFLKHYKCILDYTTDSLEMKKIKTRVSFMSRCCPCVLDVNNVATNNATNTTGVCYRPHFIISNFKYIEH